MAGRSIARIEHNDSDLRFRDKVNSNFAALASKAGLDAATIQLIADSQVIADILLALNTRLAPDDILAGNGISVSVVDGLVTVTNSNIISLAKTKFTAEGGFAILLINGTGADSVKGSLVACSTTANDSFILQSNEYDTIGVVYEDDVESGDLCWVVVSGIAESLVKNNTAITRGQIAIAADTDGRVIGIANPGSGLPAVDTHFKEVGHFLQSVSAGTDVLCRQILHFN